MWHRVKRSLRAGLLLLGAGLLYALLYRRTGFGIPCPVRALSGLYCPACGATRMCIDLLRGEWAAAFRSNPALFLLLPALAGLFCWIEIRYWRVGTRVPSRVQTVCAWALIILLLLFGVLRNLPPLYFLRPGG